MTKINLEKFSKEELQKIVESCSDKTELAKALEFNYSNGKINKKINDLLVKFEISTNHFDSKKKVKARRKYTIIKKNCPVCDKNFETQVGNKEERTTCSYECSNTYFANIRHTNESKSKVSKSLSIYHHLNGTAEVIYSVICLYCNCVFQTIKEAQKYCSNSCSAKNMWQNEKYRENIIGQLSDRIANGTHKGWASRFNLKPSYPEKYVMSLLDSLHIKYERELKVNKWFIDFSNSAKKLALEIDGKQHEWPERKASDLIKDKYLTDNGWKVLRIKWRKIDKQFRDELLDLLNKFF